MTLDSTPSNYNITTPPMSPLKELSGRKEEVFTSTLHKLTRQRATGETSPTTTTPPNTPTKTPGRHRRLSKTNSYGYRQVCVVRSIQGFIYPLTPRSNFVLLLTVNHTVLIMLVQRIWYWIN